jgi:outer membrane protein insertion porin family
VEDSAEKHKKQSLNKKGERIDGIHGVAALFVMLLVILIPSVTFAQERERVAVLPFKVYAPEPIDHLKRGLQEMLASRLDHLGYETISAERINTHPLAFKPQLETGDIVKVGEDLDAAWVVAGSLTQIGRQMSLDVRAVDVTGVRPPFFVFMVAERMSELPQTADRLVQSIHHQIAQVPEIDSIEVRGNQRIEKEAILAVVETKKGDRIDYDRLDQDLRSIYKMGFFENVETEIEDGPKGKIVIFKVTEKPSIGKIVFKGNDEIDDDDLKAELGIKQYAILDRNEVKQGIKRLEEFYRSKAYYNVEITDSIETLPDNQVLLEYQIQENEKVYIEDIRFVGNEAFDDGDLKDVMETSEWNIISFITKAGLLDEKKLEFDVQKITSFYHNHGYIKARVGEPKISFEEGEGLIITMEVQEGPQYRVNKVEVTGDLIRPEEELLLETKILKEKVFNREVLRQDILTLREVYANEGYAYAEVAPVTQEDDTNHLVDITYRISKGPMVTFERINITGNTKTRDKVIRRELRVQEGDFYSGRGLRRSSENLHRLGYFEQVDIQTQKGSQDDTMILDIDVTERPTGSFSFGAGYSSVDKAIGTITVQQDNLFGRGQKLQAGVTIGGRTQEYDVRFTEPWLLDKPISGQIHLYNWEREYDDYTKDSFGGALTIGFPIYRADEFTRGWGSYRYEDSDVTDVSPTASTIIKDSEGRSVTSSVSVGIRRNSTDRAWNPTRGSINSISIEYAGGFLGGDNYFTKYLGRSAWYFPLFWETVFLVQGRAGWVDQRSGGNLPVYERFYLGGINTVRGFDYADLSPIDPATLERVGGEYMVNFNAEYRFPLIKDQEVTGLVFVDGGNVYTDDRDLIERDFAFTGGVGVRWYSPIGPLRLEYGWILNPEKDPPWNEPGGNLEFSVGAAF